MKTEEKMRDKSLCIINKRYETERKRRINAFNES